VTGVVRLIVFGARGAIGRGWLSLLAVLGVVPIDVGFWAFHPLDLVLQVLHFEVLVELFEQLIPLQVELGLEMLGTTREPADPLACQMFWQLLPKLLLRFTSGGRVNIIGVDELHVV